jgi:hypothetical protein
MITDLEGRWRTLQLLGPVFELINRAAPRADFAHQRYDLAQLALRLLDFVVINQASLEGSVSPASVVDHLTQLARRMCPDDESKPWNRVASMVLTTMLNDGRPHIAHWQELSTGSEEWSERRPFRFRLLRLGEADGSVTISATDEAIVLFLQALNTDLANRALALKLLVEVQMKAGEFDKAFVTARQATRTAQGLSASLREKLDDTRRDVRSVDWHGEMPEWLNSVLAQLEDQLARDRQLRELATKAGEDPDAAPTCRAIVEEVKRGEDVWLRLERHLQRAIPVFLAAQEAQRFHPRGPVAAFDLVEDVLLPCLGADDGLAGEVATTMAAGALPPKPEPQWGLGELCGQLLREPVFREPHDPVPDDPGELGDAAGDSIPEDVAAAAEKILIRASGSLARLSTLLEEARQRADEVSNPDRLTDVLWGAAFYVFVAGGEAAQEETTRQAGLAAALAKLVAVADGAKLTDPRYQGPDLLLATPAELDRLDAESEGTT